MCSQPLFVFSVARRAEDGEIFLPVLILGLLTGALTVFAARNPAGEEDLQSWNDLQITAPINKYVEFTTAITIRLGKNISRLHDSRYAFGST